jgi:hypothetical protein
MKPLVERLGQDFFRAAPREPGVYVMRDARAQILYIGQSKNLRTRLAYYKNANPDRMPRRLVRLVHHVETITWECTPSPAAARARELELLRLHRPRFNRADTGPQFFHYLQLQTNPTQLTIQLHLEDISPPQPNWRGPIRGKTISALALAALQRLWTIHTQQLHRCTQLPLTAKRLTQLQLTGPENLIHGASQFFHRIAPDLIVTLLENCHPQTELPLRQLQETDAELLLSWFKVLAETEKDFCA